MKLNEIFILILLVFFQSISFPQLNKYKSPRVGYSGYPVLYSGYDYLYNNSALKTMDLVDLNVYDPWEAVMVGMQSLSEGGARYIAFSYGAFGAITTFKLHSYSTSYSSPSLQYCDKGPLAHLVLVLANKQDTLRWVQIELDQFTESYFDTPLNAINPSFVYLHDGTIWLSSADMNIYKSTDVGISFQHVTNVGEGDSNFGPPTNSPAELPLHSSSDGQFLSVVGAFEGAYLSGNPDVVYLYYSTDYGVNWQGEVIGIGSRNNPEYGQIVNRNYAPFFTGLAQGNAVVDDVGITHVVYNGFGEGILQGASDTTLVFPVLYWNSNYREWKAITDVDKEASDDGHGNRVIDYYPGNAIGNAYPTISVSSEGHRVLVFWTGPEYDGYNQPFHLYPGDGGVNSIKVYYTDTYVAVSYAGGQDIGGGFRAFDTKYNVMEMYPYANDRINIEIPNWIEAGIYKVLNDSIPGVSIFDENSFALGNWSYGAEAFYFPSVKDENGLTEFVLHQNYPNPFNPSTRIKYEIPKLSFIILRVYDILGNKVATLVNEEKPAGGYEIQFNAKELTSGLYFYTFRSGEFVQTKKMILLK